MMKQSLAVLTVCGLLLCGGKAFARGPHKGPVEKHAEGREMNRAANPTEQGVNVFKQVEQSEQRATNAQLEAVNSQTAHEASRTQASTQIYNQAIQQMNQGVQQTEQLSEQLRQSAEAISSDMQQSVDMVHGS